jgi:hypothetical protein
MQLRLRIKPWVLQCRAAGLPALPRNHAGGWPRLWPTWLGRRPRTMRDLLAARLKGQPASQRPKSGMTDGLARSK